jgi:transglutaminase-like putative cysteine protease
LAIANTVTIASQDPELGQCICPTRVIDSDNPQIIEFARRVTVGKNSDIDRAVALYHAVRDGIRYDPYRINVSVAGMRASETLARKYGFCVPKAILLAAAARSLRVPSRLGFADVKNHLSTERLRRSMRTDLFVFHGYTELYLEDKWVKATPAFNASLCERFNVEPLDFDGRIDSVFQQIDKDGNVFMQYVRDRGTFVDLPLQEMLAAFEEHYPSLMSRGTYKLTGAFEDEALS